MIGVVFFLLLSGDLATAEQALARGEPHKAIALLGDLVEADHAPVRALAVLGRAHLRLGNIEAALDPLLRASDRAPEDKGLARDAAYACYGRARGQFARGGQFARAYLEDARRYAERSGEGLLLADVDYALGNLEEALSRYRGAEAPDDQRLRVRRNVADCLRRLGREEEAKAAEADVMEEAIRRGDLGTAFRSAFAAGKGGGLLRWLDERIAEAPDLKHYWYRGHARERLLLYEQAAEDFREVLRLRPGQLEAKTKLVSVLIRQGTREQRPELLREAERLAREVLAANPAEGEAFRRLHELALYAWQNRETERAYDLSRPLHEIDPGQYDANTDYANMARRPGKYDEAETAYRHLLDEYPDDDAILNDYGILQDGRGNTDVAIRLWKRALEENPRNLNALGNLFTKAWERGDEAARDRYLRLGLDVASSRGDDRLLGRWRWFGDRLKWAPSGFGQ